MTYFIYVFFENVTLSTIARL